jgi:hypothetical protein
MWLDIVKGKEAVMDMEAVVFGDLGMEPEDLDLEMEHTMAIDNW